MDRPLKKRGYRDIQLVSDRFREYGFKPDAIFSSPAMRARLTADLFIKATSNEQIDFKITDRLYDFSGPGVVEFIKSLSNKYDKVIIFGHNHAFTSISNIFGNLPIDNVPTSGLVHLKFKISKWENLKKGKTKLMLFPRDLKK